MEWFEFLHRVIGPDTDGILWWQMTVRALVIFVFGLVLVRLFGRRAFGEYTPLDIVLAIIIGSNLSRTLTANAPFLPTLASTTALAVAFWLLGLATARWAWLARVVKGRPTWLMRDGRLDHKAMLGVGIGRGDIEEAARRSGKPGLEALEEAVIERSGKISTIARK